MSTSVLIVERPGQFRDGLLREVSQRGAQAHVRDDAMQALASLSELDPSVVLVSDDPGPPGAVSLCRLLRRRLGAAAVYRLGEPSLADVIDERCLLLPRAVGPTAIASLLLDAKPPANDAAWTAHRAWSAPLGSLELGPLLLAIGTRWLTGRLILTRSGCEREIVFVRGMPVHASSSVLSERLGALCVRRGLFNEAQLEQALDLAQARGLRLGEALLELGALDSPRLFAALSAQLVEQLVAACNSGAGHARFMLDHSIALRTPLLRLSPLTVLLHAVQQTSPEDLERVLDELADRALAQESLPHAVEQWLSDLQLPDSGKLVVHAPTVRGLRAHLRETLPSEDATSTARADAVTLALLRSGAFHMLGRSSMVPTDLRAGIRTLSPPSIASAVVRCAHSSFEDWPVSALAQARTPLELGIDDYLHGKRTLEVARELALRGPEADCDPAHAEVYALYLRMCGAQHPFAGLELGRGASVAELRLRCHELQKRLDVLESEHAAPMVRAQIIQLRAQLDRALAVLPEPHSEVVSSRAPSVLEVRANSNAPRAGVSHRPEPQRSPVPRSPLPPARIVHEVDATVIGLVEPLVQQGKWHELRVLLASRVSDPRQLPAALGLLYAIALKEETDHRPLEPGSKPAEQAEELGIRAVSQLLSVSEQSALAIVVAKRALRLRRPLDWNQKPPARVSLLLVVAALVAGAFVGLLLHPSLLGLFWR
jgi:hypothetical protein